MSSLRASPIALTYDDDGSGSPIVFLHGGWLSGESWAKQRERFGDDHRIVVPDLRGHGKTGSSDAGRYSIDLLADDLDALLSELGIDESVICGLSLGAMVAQTYAARHPERVMGIALAGAVRTFPPVSMPRAMKRLFTPIPMIGASLAMTGSEGTFRSLLSTIRPLADGPWLARDPEVRDAALRTVEAVSRAEFKKTFSALYRFRPPELDGLSVPARVIYGEYEIPPVKRQSEDLARTLEADVYEVSDAAHLVNQDSPREFNGVLSGLLTEVETTS